MNLDKPRRQTPTARQRFITLTSLLALGALCAAALPASAKVMQAPGTRVSIDLPENFKSSPIFAGFMEIISSAAVIVLEMPPEAYGQVVAGFTPEALSGKGIVNVRMTKLARPDDHIFLTGQQKHRGALFEKFILITKDDKNTAVVSFNVPEGSLTNGSLAREDVIKAMTSARLEAEAAPSKDLFKLGFTGQFELVGRPIGTSRIYAEKNEQGPKDTRNVIAIAPSLNRLPVDDLNEFSKVALDSMNNNKDLTVKASKPLKIDGMRAHLLTATAKRGAADTPVIIRQVILTPESGGYFRILAVIKESDEARLGPDVEKLIASFKATDALAVE
ncbi:MAG: hypothetical protein KKB37_03130 [Alphaproteobacteria bacterium]|nr:hypothetical protein [Alphaproteobacteria bacterium]